MADRLFLSFWLDKKPTLSGKPVETMLDTFPFSRLWQPIHLTVRAISTREATLLEDSFAGPAELPRLKEAIAAWTTPDISVEIEARWDLFAFEGGDWKLAPSRVVLASFGPDFERDETAAAGVGRPDDLRIEFGREAAFLPEPDSPGSYKPIESNIRSLLKLVKDLDGGLKSKSRLLWSESGENIAQRLAAIVSTG